MPRYVPAGGGGGCGGLYFDWCIKLSMRTTTGTPDFWGKNSISPESLLATKPLTKEPEDSGYEIAIRAERGRVVKRAGPSEKV